MERVTLCTKRFAAENNSTYDVKYTMLCCAAEWGRYYGVEIEMLDGQNVVEKETVEGLSESKKDVEKFIRSLWEATALPVELPALCDDFISKREFMGKYEAALAAS